MKLLRTSVVLLSALLAISAAPRVVEEFSAKVVGITDGDTIKVLRDKQQITIRLEGIDAPEAGQAFGTKAKLALSNLVTDKTVIVKKTGTDKYGRTLAIIIDGEVDVNAKLVELGWAWHFKEYSTDENLATLEVEAQEAKRGFWKEPNNLPPWEYRERQRSPARILGRTDSPATIPSTLPGTKPLSTSPAPTTEEPATARYWLNSSSGVRHNQRCQWFNNTNSGRFCGPTDGKACGVCGG